MMLFLQALWFLLPAGIANMAPVFASHLFPKWTCPVDGGKTIAGIRIFGDHKTLRGLASGIIFSTVTFGTQQIAYHEFVFIRNISILDYASTSVLMGTLMGAGALGGDLVKSFFKRRVSIAPGKSWFPFDQIDWILGTLLVVTPVARVSMALALTALTLSLVLSMLIRWIGFLIRLNTSPI